MKEFLRPKNRSRNGLTVEKVAIALADVLFRSPGVSGGGHVARVRGQAPILRAYEKGDGSDNAHRFLPGSPFLSSSRGEKLDLLINVPVNSFEELPKEMRMRVQFLLYFLQ